MPETVWKVIIKKGWMDLEFEFGNAADAEQFANSAVNHYIPDKDKFSVRIAAVFADDVVREEKEVADA